MGYAVYKVGERFGGTGVPAFCEYPTCKEEIDRGMSFACGGGPFSEYGCDRYFCSKHLSFIAFNDEGKKCRHRRDDCDCECVEVCDRCSKNKPPFPYKPEHPDWIKHLLTDKSWEQWRKNNPEKAKELTNNHKYYGKTK